VQKLRSQRLEQLDSLRGIAAFTVLVHHFLLVFPTFWIVNPAFSKENWFLYLITFTPFHVFWCGPEAVVFFFVLSGFVLALPFFDSTKTASYAFFLIKRTFRIYPPYLGAVILAVLVNEFLFRREGISGLSNWFNGIGQYPTNWSLVVRHVLFLGSFNSCKFDPVLWSLVQEMRISIVFPLLMYFVLNLSWKLNFLIGFFFGGLAIYLKHLEYNGYLNMTDYPDTLGYVGFFILGAVLAKNKNILVQRFRALGRPAKHLLFWGAVLAYTHNWWMTRTGLVGHGIIANWLSKEFIKNCGISLGVAIFIIAALSSGSLTGFLAGRIPCFLGKISYSLYLFHAICLVAFIDLFYSVMPIWIILAIALLASIFVSVVSYYAVEIPAMAGGKIFGNLWIRGVQK
jgi:peptidoglycan/LPS O-acetylase OafA/YrhL